MDEENQEDEESKPDEKEVLPKLRRKITFMNGENEDERVQTFCRETLFKR